MNTDLTFDPGTFPFLLSSYYQHFFPYKYFVDWLNYGSGSADHHYLAHREFSFTLNNDVYVRFQSFDSLEEFKTELQKSCPVKIDIGAVYSVKPKLKKTVRPDAFVPMEKELVFDIDMTDYDDIRTCCQGASICSKCWLFMTAAIKILDQSLKNDFGFSHLLWVYSGRRGVHCWVCDPSARHLSNEARQAITSYFDVVKGGMHMDKKTRLPSGLLHPFLQTSYDVLRSEYFPVLLETQQFAHNATVLKLIPTTLPPDTLQDIETWDQSTLLRDLIFQLSYPRLDDKVSTNVNHLLKAPFCAHPQTGRICVPIDPQYADQFDPFTVPTIADLVNECNRMVSEDSTQSSMDWRNTSLKPHIEYFKKFIMKMNTEVRQKLKREQEDSMEF